MNDAHPTGSRLRCGYLSTRTSILPNEWGLKGVRPDAHLSIGNVHHTRNEVIIAFPSRGLPDRQKQPWVMKVEEQLPVRQPMPHPCRTQDAM